MGETAEGILLVEDDKQVATLLDLLLRQANYEIFTATDGEGALAVLKQHTEQIRLIIADLNLGNGPGGSEVASEAVRIKPSLKVILISGYLHEVSELPDNLGQDNAVFLHKPFNFSDMLAKINLMLGK